LSNPIKYFSETISFYLKKLKRLSLR